MLSPLLHHTILNNIMHCSSLLSTLLHLCILRSMGGAVAVHTAVQNYLPSLAGLVVIDVVEGELH